MPQPQITLIGKPECHLCDDARTTVTAVLDELAITVPVDELSILDDSALFDRYKDEIPVVLINGKVHSIWRVNATRLRSALTTIEL